MKIIILTLFLTTTAHAGINFSQGDYYSPGELVNILAKEGNIWQEYKDFKYSSLIIRQAERHKQRFNDQMRQQYEKAREVLRRTAKDAAMMTLPKFQSVEEAKAFGAHYFKDEVMLNRLANRRRNLSNRLDQFMILDPKKYRDIDSQRIHFLGMQISYLTIALINAGDGKSTPGAGFYAGIMTVKEEK